MLNVLIVEDSDDDTALIIRQLQRSGCYARHLRVETAREMEQALADKTWDCVISDYNLPQFDGLSALKTLRRIDKDIPFIIVSANIGEDIATMAMKAGAQDYIMKGNLTRLAPAIEREIKEARIRHQHRLAEDEMRKLSSAIEQTADIVVITDRDGVIEYVNSAFTTATGYIKDEVRGKKTSILKSGEHDERFYQSIWHTIQNGKYFQDVFVNRRKDGSLYYEEKTITPLHDEKGDITNFISTGKDITEQVETQERLQHITHHDMLTGLPNRSLFVDRLTQAISRARWNKRVVAVLFFDLDRFKNINETLGFSKGDAVLCEVARRLIIAVRDGDTVARLGDDEFAVALEDVARGEDIPQVTEKILEAIAMPHNVDGRELFATTSIGISVYPDDADDANVLIQNADIALHHAKEAGVNQYRYYKTEMNSQSLYRLNMESSLRRGLEREEFVLYYQPQVDVKSGRIAGVEALLRWQHPELGLVLPGEFIGLLEETDMILYIGQWVMLESCKRAKAWLDEHDCEIKISVNLSPVQFRYEGLSSMIKAALEKSGLPAHLLEVELTESTIMQDPEAASRTLNELVEMGVSIAIDDFGTGYSSLSYLQKFSIGTLKIDRSFITDVDKNDGNASISSAIISLAHNLGLTVVGEGVENEGQFEFLKTHHCDLVQGYLVSRPITEQALLAFLGSRNQCPVNVARLSRV
ncbi:MAG: EAL domain-containing protein [Granulosicoccaceae bacterium]|jgi:diguanylate cyclase (GGDEF)-like protein/PAS domain S-box-containing protein